MTSEETKINEEKRPLGVTIVAIVNFVFGLGGILVGFSGLYIQPYLSFCALATGFFLSFSPFSFIFATQNVS
jgi:hypothetical protein